jgi:S-adenosylmethionine hydrolase
MYGVKKSVSIQNSRTFQGRDLFAIRSSTVAGWECASDRTLVQRPGRLVKRPNRDSAADLAAKKVWNVEVLWVVLQNRWE